MLSAKKHTLLSRKVHYFTCGLQVGRLDLSGAVDKSLIEEDAPELESLLSQLVSSLQEVRTRVGPLVKEASHLHFECSGAMQGSFALSKACKAPSKINLLEMYVQQSES